MACPGGNTLIASQRGYQGEGAAKKWSHLRAKVWDVKEVIPPESHKGVG